MGRYYRRGATEASNLADRAAGVVGALLLVLLVIALPVFTHMTSIKTCNRLLQRAVTHADTLVVLSTRVNRYLICEEVLR